MPSRNKQRPTIAILFGLLLFGTALVLAVRHLIPIRTFAILFFPGCIIYLRGCGALAKARGYAARMGILFGMTPLVLLLFFVPDKTKMSKAERDESDAKTEKAVCQNSSKFTIPNSPRCAIRPAARLAHEGRRMGWEPPLPGPLLHKCVEEREKTGGFALHEPAVVRRV
jgi:hypothetical protein